MAQNFGQNWAQNFGQNMAQNFDKNMAQNFDENMAQNFDENWAQNFDENMAQNFDENMAEKLRQKYGSMTVIVEKFEFRSIFWSKRQILIHVFVEASKMFDTIDIGYPCYRRLHASTVFDIVRPLTNVEIPEEIITK